jgi:hypothetical protein
MFGGYSAFRDREDDTFTFFNTGVIDVRLAVLGSSWIANLPPSPDNPLPVELTYMSPADFLDYTELVNDKEMTPKKIKCVRIITDQIQQLNQQMNWQSRDANGEAVSLDDFPVNQLSPMQYQSRVVDIVYDYMIVGLNQFFVYKLLAGSTVTMTFVYDDFRLEDLLHMKGSNIYEKREIEKMEYLL